MAHVLIYLCYIPSVLGFIFSLKVAFYDVKTARNRPASDSWFIRPAQRRARNLIVPDLLQIGFCVFGVFSAAWNTINYGSFDSLPPALLSADLNIMDGNRPFYFLQPALLYILYCFSSTNLTRTLSVLSQIIPEWVLTTGQVMAYFTLACSIVSITITRWLLPQPTAVIHDAVLLFTAFVENSLTALGHAIILRNRVAIHRSASTSRKLNVEIYGIWIYIVTNGVFGLGACAGGAYILHEQKKLTFHQHTAVLLVCSSFQVLCMLGGLTSIFFRLANTTLILIHGWLGHIDSIFPGIARYWTLESFTATDDIELDEIQPSRLR